MEKLIVLFFLFSYSLTAQDTIRFRNNEEKAVKVSEITETKIKYNNYNNLSGPIYLAEINEVKSIRFENGTIDVFTLVKAENEPETPAYVNNFLTEKSFQKIEIVGKTLRYNHRGVNNDRLFNLIQEYPDKNKQSVLMREFNQVKTYKKNYGAGLAILFVGIAGSLISLGAIDEIGTSGFFIGTGVSITGAVMANMNRNKHNAQRIKVAKMYNGEEYDFR